MKYFLFCLLMSSTAAFAEVNLDLRIPLKVHAASITELTETNYTLLELDAENTGKRDIKLLLIHCDLKNENGYTWKAEGRATWIAASTKRTLKILGQNKQPHWTNAIDATCRLKSIDF